MYFEPGLPCKKLSMGFGKEASSLQFFFRVCAHMLKVFTMTCPRKFAGLANMLCRCFFCKLMYVCKKTKRWMHFFYRDILHLFNGMSKTKITFIDLMAEFFVCTFYIPSVWDYFLFHVRVFYLSILTSQRRLMRVNCERKLRKLFQQTNEFKRLTVADRRNRF